MRRKPGTLIPLEVSVLTAAIELETSGIDEFHGFLLAKQLRDADGARRLTAHGTLYRSLSGLEKTGLLESHWEDPIVAAEEGRPLRRLYRITPDGKKALVQAGQPADSSAASTRRQATV